jgi:7-cyano-7-deazaguanine synthase
MPYDCLILLSGGIDSTVLAYSLVNEGVKPYALTFKYGQRNNMEVYCAKHAAMQLKIPVHVIDLTTVFDKFRSALCGTLHKVPNTEQLLGDAQPITYVPWRNGIFLTISLGFAESLDIHQIYYGAQQNDSFAFFDTTPEFVQNMNTLAAMNRKHECEITASFSTTSKKDIIKKGLELKIDFSLVLSCYNPKNGSTRLKACGRCPACTQRLKAFKELNVQDPFRY